MYLISLDIVVDFFCHEVILVVYMATSNLHVLESRYTSEKQEAV